MPMRIAHHLLPPRTGIGPPQLTPQSVRAAAPTGTRSLAVRAAALSGTRSRKPLCLDWQHAPRGLGSRCSALGVRSPFAPGSLRACRGAP